MRAGLSQKEIEKIEEEQRKIREYSEEYHDEWFYGYNDLHIDLYINAIKIG